MPAMRAMRVETAFEESKALECEEEDEDIAIVPEVQARELSQAPQVVPQGKPEFTAVLVGQTSFGNWSAASRAVLAKCFVGDQSDDQNVLTALGSVTLTGGADLETVYVTLLAWFILEEAFGDYEDEWQLIVDKAKTWLESVGVQKPASLVK